MERLHWFHNYLVVIITIITLFVLGLIVWVCIKYSKRANPVARKFSHNTPIEIIWTVVPVLILVAIAGPSFSNLFYQENQPDLEAIAATEGDNPNLYPDAAEQGWITVKAQGNQWNWTYSFPDVLDDGGYPVEFVSNPLQRGLSSDDNDPARGPRNLAVDYPLVLPVNRYVRYQTAASDVIHSFAVPSFGIKTDAIPGRLNEGWFLVEEEGTYYGQCSELCGKDHAFMPIEIRVVDQATFDTWLETLSSGDFDGAFDAIGPAQIANNSDRTSADTRLARAE